MTQTELAAALGISSASVSDWISGKTKDMKGIHAYKVEKILGISLAWLFEEVGPMKPGSGSEGVIDISQLSTDSQATIRAVVDSLVQQRPDRNASGH